MKYIFPRELHYFIRSSFFIFTVRSLTSQTRGQALGLLPPPPQHHSHPGVGVGASSCLRSSPSQPALTPLQGKRMASCRCDNTPEQVPWPRAAFDIFFFFCLLYCKHPYSFWLVMGGSFLWDRHRREDEGFLPRLKQAQHKMAGSCC